MKKSCPECFCYLKNGKCPNCGYKQTEYELNNFYNYTKIRVFHLYSCFCTTISQIRKISNFKFCDDKNLINSTKDDKKNKDEIYILGYKKGFEDCSITNYKKGYDDGQAKAKEHFAKQIDYLIKQNKILKDKLSELSCDTAKKQNPFCYSANILTILKNRKLKYLIHFTHIDNLWYILDEGIKPINNIKHRCVKNDSNRFDGMTTCVCLSVEYPNENFFINV